MLSFTKFVVLALALNGVLALPMPQAQPPQDAKVPVTLKFLPVESKIEDNTPIPPNADGSPGVCPAGPGEASAKAAVKQTRRALTRRAGEEFVGYLGTTKLNGDLFVKTSQEKGSLESLSLNGGVDAFKIGDDGPGLDGDFGLGLNLQDDFLAATTRAEHVVEERKKQEKNRSCKLTSGDDVPVVCTVEAKSGEAFRALEDKLWLKGNQISPFSFGGVDPRSLLEQDQVIRDAGLDPVKALRFFARLQDEFPAFVGGSKGFVPESLFADFVVTKCLPVAEGEQDASAENFGTPTFPEFDYRQKAGEFRIKGEPL